MQKENSIYGNIIASNLTLEKANSIRSFVNLKTVGYWMFVFKNQNTGKYDVGIQNSFCGYLEQHELKNVKSFVKTAKENLKDKR